jgi:hypothetical protein
MNVPIPEMMSARKRFLKVGVCRGLERLAGPPTRWTLSDALVDCDIYARDL